MAANLVFYISVTELILILLAYVLIILSYFFSKRQEKKLKLVQDRIYQLSDKKDYGICPAPVDNSKFVKEVIRHFLGDDWYVVIPLSQGQVNHEALIQIEMQYKGAKRK